MTDEILARFENPDELRTFEKGKFELVRIAGMTFERATYEPGWKWSEHVGKALGKKSCDVEHVVLIISGRAAIAMDDGRLFEVAAGDLVYIGPGHDAWVLGEEPDVSLHLVGASVYAVGDPFRDSQIALTPSARTAYLWEYVGRKCRCDRAEAHGCRSHIINSRELWSTRGRVCASICQRASTKAA